VAKHRRYLTRMEIRAARKDPDKTEARLAACPEAASITREEAEDFLMVSIYLDSGEAVHARRLLQKAHITVPTEIASDAYRLGRHLFRRWGDPEVRAAVLARGAMQADEAFLLGIARRRNRHEIERLIQQAASPVFFAAMRQYEAPDLIEPTWDWLSDEEKADHRTLVAMAKVVMHRYMTEPEPPLRPTRWDQEKLARRLHLRDVQMRAMRKSVHHLRRQRKELMTALRERSQQARPELQALALQLAELRTARAEAERAALAAQTEQAQRHQVTLLPMITELERLRQDLAAALAERQSWLTGGKGAPS
jgi:hypothetical protein